MFKKKTFKRYKVKYDHVKYYTKPFSRIWVWHQCHGKEEKRVEVPLNAL